MNTRDLEYFTQLCKLKNFSLVANYFQVSQPTVSLALKRLETMYGIELIHRDKSHNTITVTDAGRQLEAHAQNILRELDQTQSEITALQQEIITLGLPPIIGNYFFPSTVDRLLEHGLVQHLRTVEAGSGELLAQLRNGELEMALLGSVGPLDEPDLDVTQLAQPEFTIIASKQRELGHGGQVAFSELAHESFVSLTVGFMHSEAFRRLTAANHVHPRIVFRTSDVGLIKKMVHQNVGIALLVDLAVTPDDDLQTLHLSDPDQPQFCISIVHRKHQVLSPMQRNLKKLLAYNPT
ncbi:LysR family transcriptional regulator [Lacticaseibacillus sharpeae]|uniref:Malolactic fermentation system transcription activator n=1 Tax=Lacticaseibacillus sharpeae JCM 1186 = DSM 20505 TaxID=1291052 RepID=A0A0R1ZPX8_9LACO|nr:LysR family transcriptional regulator [Lacticaseibacillus sharpeae]KRM56490.1 malolactic fermentation system transcription activator [Lacticaseibacillus sharpeae JCM 1186 = DSM 20505]